jgi:hypothetical protein
MHNLLLHVEAGNRRMVADTGLPKAILSHRNHNRTNNLHPMRALSAVDIHDLSQPRQRLGHILRNWFPRAQGPSSNQHRTRHQRFMGWTLQGVPLSSWTSPLGMWSTARLLGALCTPGTILILTLTRHTMQARMWRGNESPRVRGRRFTGSVPGALGWNMFDP